MAQSVITNSYLLFLLSSSYHGLKTNYISVTLPDMIKYLGLNLGIQLNTTWSNGTIYG